MGFSLSASGSGRCKLPGHDDKNPSFSVKNSSNTFRCFACGGRGGVINLVMLMQGQSFIEACEWLRTNFLATGIYRPTAKPIVALRKGELAKARSPDQVDREIYAWLLERTPLQVSGRKYLNSRYISDSTIEQFRVAQLPADKKMLHELQEEWGIERAVRAGLMTVSAWGPRLVFPPNYLMFPFFVNENVEYCQARAIENSAHKRWICLKGLLPPVYNENTILEGVANITICEGITDVLSATELNMKAIGLLGANASLSLRSAKALVGKNVIVIGDNDRAGKSFANRIREMLQSHSITVVEKFPPKGCADLNEYLVSKRSGLA